jgi:hypothetical protein
VNGLWMRRALSVMLKTRGISNAEKLHFAKAAAPGVRTGARGVA